MIDYVISDILVTSEVIAASQCANPNLARRVALLDRWNHASSRLNPIANGYLAQNTGGALEEAKLASVFLWSIPFQLEYNLPSKSLGPFLCHQDRSDMDSGIGKLWAVQYRITWLSIKGKDTPCCKQRAS